MKHTFIYILILFSLCKKELKDTPPAFDAFVFFNDSLSISGAINYTDTIHTRIDDDIKIRSISVTHVALGGADIFEFTNMNNDTLIALTPEDAFNRFSHPVLGENMGKKPSHLPDHIEIFRYSFFTKNNLYILVCELPYWFNSAFQRFCNDFEKIIQSQTPEQAHHIMKAIRKESNDFLHLQMLQLALHKKGYETGTYSKAFGWPLTAHDSALFNQAIIDYKKDNQFQIERLIDTQLFQSLDIPIDAVQMKLDELKQYEDKM